MCFFEMTFPKKIDLFEEEMLVEHPQTSVWNNVQLLLIDVMLIPMKDSS
jgi:hypothetical protein